MTKRNPPAPAEQCTRKALQEITPGPPQLQHWRLGRNRSQDTKALLGITSVAPVPYCRVGERKSAPSPQPGATGDCQQGCPGVIEPEGHALGIVLTPCPANCPAGGRSVLLIEQGITECAPLCKIILCLMTLQK